MKNKGDIVDLRKNSATLLGFELREQDGKVIFGQSEIAWDNLKQHLVTAHDADNPSRTAQVRSRWLG